MLGGVRMNSKYATSYQLVRYSKVLMLLFTVMGMIGFLAGTVSAQTTQNSALCSILTTYTDVVDIIFVLGLMLMILGGAMYAGANLLPGTTKGSLQGYGMGMIIGGVIGVIIAELAPFILQGLTGSSSASLTSSFYTAFNCGVAVP